MPEEMNYYGLVNKPPIDEIYNLDLVNKPDINSLAHYGILKMKWGVRKYQNPDGTLTEAGKARLRERRRRFEIKEEKRKAREEKRAAKEKVRKEKKLANPDPKWLERNMHKFTNEEIERAIKRIAMKKNIEDIQKERIDIGKHKVDTILRYGDSINSLLKFINSDAGKGIREKLGFSTETIFNFSQKEEEARKEKERQKQFNDDLKRDQIRRQRDYDDWAKKDYHRREQDLLWDNRRLDYEIQKRTVFGNNGNQNQNRPKPAGMDNTPKPTTNTQYTAFNKNKKEFGKGNNQNSSFDKKRYNKRRKK